jgi:hypothetical protein
VEVRLLSAALRLQRLSLTASLLILPTLLAVGCGSGGSSSVATGTAIASGAGPNGPAEISSSDFSPTVDNPYYPLKPGTTYRYRGVKDGRPTIDSYAVSHETKSIEGVPCVAVNDNLYEAGKLEEQTTDWYTQDNRGNVWYFGEATRELNRQGKTTTTEGSWQAGVDGARPGIFMPANPQPGQSYRQEYYKGQAEDQFKVLDVSSAVTVPAGHYQPALLTEETTPLEPGVVDHKYYARGIGNVKEVTAQGPRELAALASVSGP